MPLEPVNHPVWLFQGRLNVCGQQLLVERLMPRVSEKCGMMPNERGPCVFGEAPTGIQSNFSAKSQTHGINEKNARFETCGKPRSSDSWLHLSQMLPARC